MVFKVPEQNRIDFKNNDSRYQSTKRHGNNGAFSFVYEKKIKIFVIASDQLGWEHVSISLKDKKRCPKWPEMCFIKSLFWDDQDMVIQFHPPKTENISFHNYCLHLWRPTDQIIPAPDHLLVAPKGYN